jgi:hypothetical protein
VLFTDGEERGGVGAFEACECPQLKDTPYFIEIDRRGERQAVFYNDEEIVAEDFVKVVEKYFQIERGSFSDISILGNHFKVASTNISAGFFNEHQKSAEYIYLPALEYTIKTVPKLIEELGNKRYVLPEKYGELWWYYKKAKREELECPVECANCKSIDFDWEIMCYWCWRLHDIPDPEHPACRRKEREVEPWV